MSVVSAAPPVTVTSAVPDEAEQGTAPTIIINGRGFDKSTNVRFCLSGTNTDDNCDDGGVVPGSAIFHSSKKLEVPVAVAANANTDDYNIEAFSNGRRGRGIELFRVVKQGGGQTDNLTATFCLSIDPTSPHITSDGRAMPDDPDVYCDDFKKKVQVSSGPNPGFRWDTNLQNTSKTQQWQRWRWVHMSVDGDTPPSDVFEIDFRFNLPNGGFNLGSLMAQESGVCPGGDPGACMGTVAASITYYGGLPVTGPDDMNYGILAFGDLHGDINDIDDEEHDAARQCLADSGEMNITRTGETTWVFESNASGIACRFALPSGPECTNTLPCSFGPSDVVDFVFRFLVVQEE
jgi:hypothetical protein